MSHWHWHSCSFYYTSQTLDEDVKSSSWLALSLELLFFWNLQFEVHLTGGNLGGKKREQDEKNLKTSLRCARFAHVWNWNRISGIVNLDFYCRWDFRGVRANGKSSTFVRFCNWKGFCLVLDRISIFTSSRWQSKSNDKNEMTVLVCWWWSFGDLQVLKTRCFLCSFQLAT